MIARRHLFLPLALLHAACGPGSADIKEGTGPLDLGDELARGCLVTHQGEITHEAVKSALRAP